MTDKRNKRTLISLLLLLTTATLHANNRCCDFISGVEVYGAALYWRPTYDGAQYGTETTNQGGVLLFTTPHSNWGYRVGASLAVCNSGFYFDSNYTSFKQHNFSSTTSVGNIFPVFAPFVTNNFDSASGEIKSRYQAVDITGNYNWLCNTFWKSDVFLGARYVHFKEKETYLYLDPTGPIPVAPAFQRYGFTGWGPRLGFNVAVRPFSCSFLRCFALKGQWAGSAELGNQTNLVRSLSTGGIFPQGPLDFPDRFRTLLATDLRAELLYQLKVCNCTFKASGGYELNYYFNGRYRIDTTNTLGIAPRSTSGIGYGGPFIEASLAY